MSNVIIIGSGGAGKHIQAPKTDNTFDAFDDESFEVNGIRYTPIKVEQSTTKRTSPKLVGIMAMAALVYAPYMFAMGGYGEDEYVRKLPEGTDIVKEYGLIQLKQSKLSKWERETVVRIFEANFRRL
jgi:hypothetical protein